MEDNQKVYDVYRQAGFGDTTEQTAAEGYLQLLPSLPTDRQAPILDFGCGGGEFLGFLSSQGYVAASGIDRSREQVERCRARGLERVELVQDSSSWLERHRSTFSAIVLNDVLEHIPKPQIVETLEVLRAALHPGGRLVIKVPNAANVFGLVARYLDFTHEVAFTEHSLRQVLVAAGYHAVAISGIQVSWKPTIKRTVYWLANATYRQLHRAVYVAAVGADAPSILTKLLVAVAERPADTR